VAKSIVNEKPVKFKSEMRLREKEKKIEWDSVFFTKKWENL
jgi:hypothetical protein